LVVITSVLLLSACAGDGSGLDENGKPATGASDALMPKLSSIQQHVFTPICAGCHSGVAAPLGLRLDGDAVTYAMLVNAPSDEVPTIARVVPGNPNASYLIQKLEGWAGVGGRMPLNGPALPAETIAVIRQWIAEGATASSTASATASAKIMAIWPLPSVRVRKPDRMIVLSSNVELDATLLAAGTVTLRRGRGCGDLASCSEQSVEVAVTVRSLQPTVFVVTASGNDWVADEYELRISGSSPLALADRNSIPIDGDRDGLPGGDFVLRFTVE
jgi:hypothetical protein